MLDLRSVHLWLSAALLRSGYRRTFLPHEAFLVLENQKYATDKCFELLRALVNELINFLMSLSTRRRVALRERSIFLFSSSSLDESADALV